MEFALILPVLLSLTGACLDFARIYQVWITLEAATRDGAEAAATNSSTAAGALTRARQTICTQTAGHVGFVAPPGDTANCSTPTVTLVSFSTSTTAPGATSSHPRAAATVTTAMPFQTLFAYPLLTVNGTVTLEVTRSFEVLQGR